MGEVKRYDPFGYDGLSAFMTEDNYGDYVRHDDYAALEAENAKLRAELERRAVPDGWVSVSERMPKPNTTVLVFGVRQQIMFARHKNREMRPWECLDGDTLREKVTHWMPLPPTPAAQAAAPSAPKAGDPVKQMLLEALESAADALARAEFFEQADNARAAISAVREEVMK